MDHTVRRPNLSFASHATLIQYILYLEERVRTLETDVAALTGEPDKPYGPDGLAYTEGDAESKKAAALNLRFKREGQHYIALMAMAERPDYGTMRTELADLIGCADGTASTRLLELREQGFARYDLLANGEPRTRVTRNRANKKTQTDAKVHVLTDKGWEAVRRLHEGLPAQPPTKKDGSPAAPPSDLMPENLFDQQDA